MTPGIPKNEQQENTNCDIPKKQAQWKLQGANDSL